MTRYPTDADQDERPLEPRLGFLLLLCAIVLLFRIAAWLNPSSFIVIPPSLGLPLNGLGIFHLVCGVWAWRSNPSSLTRVFLVSGIGSAIHWGGSIAAESNGLEIAFLVFYLAATAMGDAAFLDLSLRYPRELHRRGLVAMGLYLLAGLTFLAVPIAPFLPNQVVEAGLGFVLMVAFGMSIAGGIVFLLKWIRATAAERREYSLTLIVGVLVLTTGLDLIGEAGVLPGAPEAWTLPYALVPLTLAWALTRAGVGARTTSKAQA